MKVKTVLHLEGEFLSSALVVHSVLGLPLTLDIILKCGLAEQIEGELVEESEEPE